MPYNFFVVSHTHWDREWYQPFEEFRIRLVRLMDKLLDIMASDPDYRYFTLDGQTIMLEDYLEIRPQKEEEIRRLVQQGRLLIGPWWILPDEFLVSPEATIDPGSLPALLTSDRPCAIFWVARFGNHKMG